MATRNVKSTIAGTVLEIQRNVGETVETDDPIITLECMKMEIPVVAPAGGRIAQISVSAGDVVHEGQVVCVLET